MPNAPQQAAATRRRASPRRPIEIALVNNMPDAALLATERQFAGLLAEAAGEAFDVTLRFYALAGVPRGELARATMQDRYAGLETMKAVGADAVIVTGAEPRADDLRNETYWPELASLIDWCRAGGPRSTLFSCLAAHAAALHLDGIERRRLPTKALGVFAFQRLAKHPLTRGLGRSVRTPHSRHNALPFEALIAHGYQVLTRSAFAGVDVFTRQDEGCLLVFLQGHPEYDPDTLMREYRRDLGRFQRGEQSSLRRPSGYFDPATERALDQLTAEAESRGETEPLGRCDEIAAASHPSAPWRTAAVRLYRNWLEAVDAAKTSLAAATPDLATQPLRHFGQTG